MRLHSCVLGSWFCVSFGRTPTSGFLFAVSFGRTPLSWVLELRVCCVSCLRSCVLRPASPDVSICVLVLCRCSNSKRDVEATYVTNTELHTQTGGSQCPRGIAFAGGRPCAGSTSSGLSRPVKMAMELPLPQEVQETTAPTPMSHVSKQD